MSTYETRMEKLTALWAAGVSPDKARKLLYPGSADSTVAMIYASFDEKHRKFNYHRS